MFHKDAGLLNDLGSHGLDLYRDIVAINMKITGAMKDAGLILESSPPSSVYLSGRSGRVAAPTKLRFASQTSTVLVAHKTANFTCNGGGVVRNNGVGRANTRSTTLEAPRQHALENVGVVLPKSTLATAPTWRPRWLTSFSVGE